MKYNPHRDIPKACRELRSTSPTKIVEWIKNNRTETEKGRRIQKVVSPQSISMFFKRHSDVLAELERQIPLEELNADAVSEALFENGTFEKIPCIENWMLKMTGRGAKGRARTQFLRAIKYVCMGILPATREKKDHPVIEGWGLIHPSKLTVERCLRYMKAIEDSGRKTASERGFRLAFRNFLMANNIPDADTISGELSEGAGQYAHLFVPKPKLDEVFAFVHDLNEIGYMASKTSFKCGGIRRTALLNIKRSDIDVGERSLIVWEKASRHKPKRRQERFIPADLWDELMSYIAKHEKEIGESGRLFPISALDLGKLLKTAYANVIPELAKVIPSPIHFLRHQFAQHGLRATDWNYGLVARWGGWTTETLERYYGKMDRKTVRDGARKFLVAI